MGVGAACVLIASSCLGQFPGRVGYGRGGFLYGQTPLWLYDPIRYSRFYSGQGFYNYPPPVFAPPKVLVPRRSVMSLPGLTGRVVGLDQRRKLIHLRLAAETITVPFGPFTKFDAVDGGFPEIAPGMLVNVNQNRVVVLARGEPSQGGWAVPPPPAPGQ
jgi:hypothetical protein